VRSPRGGGGAATEMLEVEMRIVVADRPAQAKRSRGSRYV
jgi:hypothetical protein